jgi:hypothetical protein
MIMIILKDNDERKMKIKIWLNYCWMIFYVYYYWA